MTRLAVALQAAARGFLIRRFLASSRHALDKHVNSLKHLPVPPAQASGKAVPPKRPTPSDPHAGFHALERMVGRKEEQKYIEELNGRRASLAKRIAEMEKAKPYMPTDQQKVTNRELKVLKSEIEHATEEALLVKRHAKARN